MTHLIRDVVSKYNLSLKELEKCHSDQAKNLYFQNEFPPNQYHISLYMTKQPIVLRGLEIFLLI